MSKRSDFIAYAASEYFTGRPVISPAGTYSYRVEILWTDREEWHDRVMAHLTEQGNVRGANACTNFEPWIVITPEGFTVSGTVNFYLLADAPRP